MQIDSNNTQLSLLNALIFKQSQVYFFLSVDPKLNAKIVASCSRNVLIREASRSVAVFILWGLCLAVKFEKIVPLGVERAHYLC